MLLLHSAAKDTLSARHRYRIAGFGIKAFSTGLILPLLSVLSDHCSLRSLLEPRHHGVGSVGLVMSDTRSLSIHQSTI